MLLSYGGGVELTPPPCHWRAPSQKNACLPGPPFTSDVFTGISDLSTRDWLAIGLKPEKWLSLRAATRGLSPDDSVPSDSSGLSMLNARVPFTNCRHEAGRDTRCNTDNNKSQFVTCTADACTSRP